MRERYARMTPADRERRNAQARARYAANPEPVRARLRARYAADPEEHQAVKRKSRRKRIGIANPPSETRTAECEICGKFRRLNCDHDHETGQVRGWLCYICNIFLGPTGSDRVAAAARYMEKAYAG